MSPRRPPTSALLAIALVLTCRLALAHEPEPPPSPAEMPRTNIQALVIGKSTLQEAEAFWRETGARPGRSGNLAIGFKSGVDGSGDIAVEQVVLVDVEGVEFEGFTVARYGFVDGVLYSVQVSLGLDLSKVKSVASKDLSKEEFGALEAQLRRKHGKPSRELRDLFGGRRNRANILVWRVGANELTLADSVHKFLRLENLALAKKVDAYRKAVCKKQNRRSRIPECW
jgi:hypothetical protein